MFMGWIGTFFNSAPKPNATVTNSGVGKHVFDRTHGCPSCGKKKFKTYGRVEIEGHTARQFACRACNYTNDAMIALG